MGIVKVIRIIGYIITILAVPVLLLSGSLAWGFNSHWLYNNGYARYDVSSSTGLPLSELHKTTDALIDYFNSSDEYVQVTVTSEGRTFELFTLEEQIHFKDVKKLVRLDFLVMYISLVLLVVLGFLLVIGDFRNNWKKLGRALMWGSLLSILLIIVIAAAAYFNFDNLFLQFHYLAFTNEYWSAGGYMLLLFPGDFWYYAAYICVAFMAGLAIVIGLLNFALLKWDDSRRLMTH